VMQGGRVVKGETRSEFLGSSLDCMSRSSVIFVLGV
jgi:hypothetical protein